MKGKCKTGIKHFRKSIFKNPLLKSADPLYEENIKIGPILTFDTDIIVQYYLDLTLLLNNDNIFKCDDILPLIF